MPEEQTETQQNKLIVEQTQIDKVLEFPIFRQVENIDSNIGEVLSELQKINETLNKEPEPVEEVVNAEPEPMQEIIEEESEELPEEEFEFEEFEYEIYEVVEEEPEEEVVEENVIDYDPLVLEQLEILNAHMEVSLENQQKQMELGSETGFMLVLTIVAAIALKVFVEQMTKW